MRAVQYLAPGSYTDLDSLRVVDVTHGFRGDAFLLATAGINVWIVEDDPVVHCCLEDGLRRAQQVCVCVFFLFLSEDCE